jgi:hypothetical protein
MANPSFYALATRQGAGGAAVFHDITGGNNSVPGQSGFSATAGYDQATGLGSVDASVLVDHWGDASAHAAFSSTPSTRSVSINTGSRESLTLNVAGSSGFDAAVAFSVSGLPRGVSAVFNPETLRPPGSGSTVLELAATKLAKHGTYDVIVSSSSGSAKQTAAIAVTVK